MFRHKKNKIRNKTKNRSQNHKKSNQNKSNQNKSRKTKYRNNKTKRQNNNRKTKQRGGANCNVATVQESAFNIPSIGDIAGLSIPSSRAVIYQPDCKIDTYQAMTP
jgi:hypothetical protein